MGLFIVSLSDVGEGVAEAELVEWNVAVGDSVAEDQVLGAVMTDKAAVDVPSSVLGKVVKLCAEVGDVVSVGSPLVEIEVDGPGNTETVSSNTVPPQSSTPAATTPAATTSIVSTDNSPTPGEDTGQSQVVSHTPREGSVQPPPPSVSSGRTLAAPSVRKRARDLNVDINSVSGSGPAGRVVHEDLDQFTERRSNPQQGKKVASDRVNQIKVVGMRRIIAEKMAMSKSRIPHITIVEEIDVHNLEELRSELNENHASTRGKLTILPFVMKSIIEAVAEQPSINARYDDDAGIVDEHSGVHIGIATQTPNGLVVPVVRHSEVNSLWDNAQDIARLAEACREGTIEREEMGNSTITITSLGPLGAVATTPIINYPEVAIVGINKMMIRPHWDGQQFVPRKMMNLSCSFDHRVIDGWDAAVFVQKLKSLLEKPAMLFVDN